MTLQTVTLTIFKILWKIYLKVVQIVCFPLAILDFLSKNVGKDYNVTTTNKIKLICTFHRNCKKMPTASHFLEHLEMARYLLSLPKHVEGNVIECGCYAGGGSTNLSLICRIIGRKLLVCDSFSGLPEPNEDDRIHILPGGKTSSYSRGMFSCSLDTVKNNIQKYGDISVCEFVPGWFQDTLPLIEGPFIMGFIDVDLKESLNTCVKYLYKKFSEGSRIYCHEAPHLDNVKIFFDNNWFNVQFKEEAPGFYGAGTGLPLLHVSNNIGSALGYAIKGGKSKDGRRLS